MGKQTQKYIKICIYVFIYYLLVNFFPLWVLGSLCSDLERSSPPGHQDRTVLHFTCFGRDEPSRSRKRFRSRAHAWCMQQAAEKKKALTLSFQMIIFKGYCRSALTCVAAVLPGEAGGARVLLLPVIRQTVVPPLRLRLLGVLRPPG